MTAPAKGREAAASDLGIAKRYERGRWPNNRAKNSHQPTRRRERKIQGFKSVRASRTFLAPGAQEASNACVLSHYRHFSCVVSQAIRKKNGYYANNCPFPHSPRIARADAIPSPSSVVAQRKSRRCAPSGRPDRLVPGDHSRCSCRIALTPSANHRWPLSKSSQDRSNCDRASSR